MSTNPNLLPSDDQVLVGAVDPQDAGVGTVSTGWISFEDIVSIQAIISVGTLGASGTVDANLEEAKDNTGTDAQAISGKAITQLTQAGGDDDKQAIINCFEDDLSGDDDYTHFRLNVVVGTAASPIAASVLSNCPVYRPDDAVASLAEVVS